MRRRNLLLATLPMAALLSGCGTLLYPERRGQPAGPIDWKVVALDGLGLLFFFIPGVIAFAVDFSTGAIYLPPEACISVDAKTASELVQVQDLHPEPTLPEIEQVVSQHTAREIKLRDGYFITRPLKNLRDFWTCRAAALAET